MTNAYEAKNGNLTTSTYGNGFEVGYGYDTLDRLTSKTYNGVRKFAWSYNRDGQIGRHRDYINSIIYEYQYDFLGRITRIDGSDGSYLANSYNTVDLSTKLQYRYAGTSKTVAFTYDSRDNLPKTVALPGERVVTNTYDDLGRLTKKDASGIKTNYAYLDVNDTKTTGIISGLTYTGITAGDLSVGNLTYTYDNLGNIKTVKEGTALKESYVYDALNQLTRHDSVTQNKTIVYTYDAGGNILNRKEYAYTTDADLSAATPTSTVVYTYGDSTWKDKLTAYDGQAIAYDAIGNPITYRGWSNTWQGRQLSSTSQGGMTLSFKYNVDGIRTQKTVNGTATNYFLNGNKILAQKTGSTVTWFYYDQNGTRVAMEHGGKLYYYLYNLQGDVIALCDASTKQIVAKYSYDAWGKLLTKENLGTGTIADVNPFRYRGYYYDSETGMYYLNSRYYDPEVGRFLNADVIMILENKPTVGNLFAYCKNTPIIYADYSGFYPCSKCGVYTPPSEVHMNCGKPKPKPKPNPQEPSDGFTIGIGCGGSAAAGAKVDGNVGCVVDSQGNFGDFASGGIGGGTPSASVSGYIQITNAPSVDKLAGQAYQVGGSAWIIGLEILVIPDKDTGEVYYGVNLGVSFGPLPEVHGETSFTAMSNVINIPDCIDQILENY